VITEEDQEESTEVIFSIQNDKNNSAECINKIVHHVFDKEEEVFL
jgi:hypothetical protein